jgi:hypothetical protein
MHTSEKKGLTESKTKRAAVAVISAAIVVTAGIAVIPVLMIPTTPPDLDLPTTPPDLDLPTTPITDLDLPTTPPPGLIRTLLPDP